MNRFLVVIGGLLVGLLALMFVAPVVVDWNRYRGVFEEEATRFLGREVRVGGRVDLRLLPVPYVRFEKVRVADTTANVGKPLFMADDFTVWLSVGSLMAGSLEAKAIELKRPVVTLVLDGNGGGSWSSLAPGKWATVDGPMRIAFDAVRITDGQLAILTATGRPRATFDHVNGEVSAGSLAGPYKLSAAFAASGGPREVRVSTAAPAEDGSVRVKGTVRDPASGLSYTIDGLLKDPLGRTSVRGDLTARVPMPSILDGGVNAAQLKRGDKAEFDVRAKVTADTAGMLLKDLSLSFEQGGRPQLATGEAKVAWSEQTNVGLTLKSHWLDLDHIAGGTTKPGSPLKLVQTLAKGLARVLATEGQTQAILEIDQATLGGDVVSDLSVTLEHVDGKLAVRDLRAGLPGGARLGATGAFDIRLADPRYDGRVDLRGASLKRFLGWAGSAPDADLGLRDGPFSLSGELSLASGAMSGRNMAMHVGRNSLTGTASWQAGAPQSIKVDLEGSEIDLSPLVGKGLSPTAALREQVLRLAGKPAGQAGKTANAAGGVDAANAEIQLQVDRVVAGSAVFRDVALDMRVLSGDLTLNRLRYASGEGYEIDIKGDVARLARADAKGTIAGSGSATTAGGVKALARLVDLPAELTPSDARASAAVPARLAVKLDIGMRGPGTAEASIDGLVGPERLSGSVRLGAEAAGWKERSIDLALTLEGSGLRELLAGATGAAVPAAGAKPRDAKVLVRGIGKPRDGLRVLGVISGDGIRGEYKGLASLEEKHGVGLAGELDIELKDAANGLALAGLAPNPAISGPVDGLLKIERKGGRLGIETDQLVVAGTVASAKLAIDAAVADGYRVTGTMKVAQASLPSLLAGLSTGRAPTRAGAQPSPWSEAALDLSGLDAIAGSKVRVEVQRLALAPGSAVEKATLDIAARPGGLDIAMAQASAAGGRASGRLTLDKAPAGARMSAEARLTGARLEKLVPVSRGVPVATGGLSLSLKGESVALTPRGLVVALAGSGKVSLAGASLKKWNPSSIASAAEAVIATKGEIPPGALRQLLELSLAKTGVGIGSRQVSAKLVDGSVRFEPLVVNTSKGRLKGDLIVDLDQQRIDGAWRLEPKGTGVAATETTPAKPELPGVNVVFSGPISAIGQVQPRLDIDALEREVAVRKVEREVAELERQRRLDEERARQEALRIEAEKKAEEQRRLEALAAQAAAAAAAQQGQAGTPGTPGVPAAGSGPGAPQAVPPIGAGGAPGALPGTQPPATANPPAPGAPGQPMPGGASLAPGQLPPVTLAVPPTTVEVTPAPAPVRRPRPAQPAARKVDPFRALREGGGG